MREEFLSEGAKLLTQIPRSYEKFYAESRENPGKAAVGIAALAVAAGYFHLTRKQLRPEAITQLAGEAASSVSSLASFRNRVQLNYPAQAMLTSWVLGGKPVDYLNLSGIARAGVNRISDKTLREMESAIPSALGAALIKMVRVLPEFKNATNSNIISSLNSLTQPQFRDIIDRTIKAGVLPKRALEDWAKYQVGLRQVVSNLEEVGQF